jgi:hypothetical protein
MKHLKHHAMHVLMCAPMFVLAGVLIAGGGGVSSLIPVVVCVVMMSFMMRGMGGMGGGDAHRAGPGARR